MFQSAPFNCPSAGCSFTTNTRAALLPHFGVIHKAVFKYYNKVMGYKSAENVGPVIMGASRPNIGRPRGSFTVRGRPQIQTQSCLVCDESVSPETMVFHLAHKHFQVLSLTVLFLSNTIKPRRRGDRDFPKVS